MKIKSFGRTENPNLVKKARVFLLDNHYIPTLVIFFLQVLITACVFSVIVFVLSLFYKGDKDESIHTE